MVFSSQVTRPWLLRHLKQTLSTKSLQLQWVRKVYHQLVTHLATTIMYCCKLIDDTICARGFDVCTVRATKCLVLIY